jgi:CheY-like chemotaxis protein
VHVLIATDADWVLSEVTAALGGAGTTFTVCRNGRDVTAAVQTRTPDVAVLDLQIGSMGGMAVTMSLRLDESAGALPHVPVVMLLDRTADLHLARRSDAEGWLVKPLDALRIRRAVTAVAGGGTYTEGIPTAPTAPEPSADGTPGEAPEGAESPDGETITTG